MRPWMVMTTMTPTLQADEVVVFVAETSRDRVSEHEHGDTDHILLRHTAETCSKIHVQTRATERRRSFSYFPLSLYVSKLRVKLHLETDGRTSTHGNNVHRDRRRHAVSTSLRLVDQRTNGRRDGQSVRPSVS